MLAIKTWDQRWAMVGHLPHEVPRITKFIIDHGATVSVMVIPEHSVEHLSSEVGSRSHSKYQFPGAGPA